MAQDTVVPLGDHQLHRPVCQHFDYGRWQVGIIFVFVLLPCIGGKFDLQRQSQARIHDFLKGGGGEVRGGGGG